MSAQDSVSALDKMNRILNGTQSSYRKLVTRNGVAVTDPNFSHWEDHYGNEVPCPGKLCTPSRRRDRNRRRW